MTSPRTAPHDGVVLARTCRAEWTRVWSVRSSWLLAAATAVVVVGVGWLIGRDAAGNPNAVSPGSSAWDGGRFTAMFALFGMLATAVVTTTADHTTGGIVPTLQWTPRRRLLVLARVIVVVGTTTVLGLVLVAAASAAAWSSVPELGLPLGDGARTLGEVGVVLVTGTGLAVGLGLALRSTAGGLVSVIALVLVLPMLFAQMPYEWSVELASRLPGSNALFLVFGEGPTADMTTTSARLTLTVWGAAALLAGAWRLLRTDADR